MKVIKIRKEKLYLSISTDRLGLYTSFAKFDFSSSEFIYINIALPQLASSSTVSLSLSFLAQMLPKGQSLSSRPTVVPTPPLRVWRGFCDTI